MPLELGEFYANGVERILHVCPWCWESFMRLELREFYMYAPGVGRVLCDWGWRILHVCPWSWESFMRSELENFTCMPLELGEFYAIGVGEFYMYAPGVGRV